MGDTISRECTCAQPQSEIVYLQQPIIEQTDKKQFQYIDLENSITTIKEQKLMIKKKLLLSVIKSSTMEENVEFCIAPNKITYFGSTEKLNDIVIPALTDDIAERQQGRQFQISYMGNAFWIKDLNIGFGVFEKILKPQLINNGALINMGMLFLHIGVFFNYFPMQLEAQRYFCDVSGTYQETTHKQMKKKIKKETHYALLILTIHTSLIENQENEQYIFVTTNGQAEITIGRDKNNLIYYTKDKLLSKKHCIIQFNPLRGWILMDTQSVNGCWQFIQDEKIIYHGMIFKANHSLFQASLEQL